MYFNVNFNVFFKLIKVHLLVSELYTYQNTRCNNKKKRGNLLLSSVYIDLRRERGPDVCHDGTGTESRRTPLIS